MAAVEADHYKRLDLKSLLLLEEQREILFPFFNHLELQSQV
jgi:hypothetical protein